jgi:chaperone required for assembly of F1-ATPase
MKRFYKAVAVGPDRTILLDGRTVRTPARAVLALTTDPLAAAIAGEWDAQGEEIDPRSMPLTGLANAAIDRIAPDPATFVATLAAYAETDLLCYRADAPPDLVARQAAQWDPLLAWAASRYDIHFDPIVGIVHRPQPAATVARLQAALAAQPPFALAALSELITIGGSLVTAFAIHAGAIDAETAFATAHLDELWQAENWGEDWMATDAREIRRRDFLAAARFLTLI